MTFGALIVGKICIHSISFQILQKELAQFIHKPKAYIKGTAMGFAGIPKQQDLANLIAYLRNQAATPAPLP